MLQTWLLINFLCHGNETAANCKDNLFTLFTLLQQRGKVQLLLAAQFLLLAQ
jgi:hypothetical protein